MTKNNARLRFLVVAGGLIVLGWFTCTFQVAESHHAIVSRFGAPVRTISQAGLHFKLPPPVETVAIIDGRIHVLDPPVDEYLTADKKNVTVDAFMAWSVEAPLQYWVGVGNRQGAEARLTDLLRSVVGEVLSAHPFAELVSHEGGDTDLEDVVEEISRGAAERTRKDFGVKIHAVRIKRLSFPNQNKQAVFQRMEAERKSFAAAYRSEGLEQSEKIKNDANRVEAQLIAEAERRAREIRGAADAEATRIYAEAFSQDPELYEFTRTLEVLSAVLDSGSTVVLPPDHELLKVLSDPRPKR